MQNSLEKLYKGYQDFRKKYTDDDMHVMQHLSEHGQSPKVMVIACSDSRVDPAVVLQCDPGDLFVVRNVANLVPPYAPDNNNHGTSAALEYGIRFLKVKHLILFGHSQCGGIQAMLEGTQGVETDFLGQWVQTANGAKHCDHTDEAAKFSLDISYKNCMQFPWIADAVQKKELQIHRWFFEIGKGAIYTHESDDAPYSELA